LFVVRVKNAKLQRSHYMLETK